METHGLRKLYTLTEYPDRNTVTRNYCTLLLYINIFIYKLLLY